MNASIQPPRVPSAASPSRFLIRNCGIALAIGVFATILVSIGDQLGFLPARIIATPFGLLSFSIEPHQGSDVAFFGSMILAFSAAAFFFLARRRSERTKK